MSWSIEAMGSKAGVKARIEKELDRTIATYDGKPEADDVRAVKDRLLALVDACALGPDGHGTDWNAVKISASGSHSTSGEGVLSANLRLEVTRHALAL